jgi:hypothetical protein
MIILSNDRYESETTHPTGPMTGTQMHRFCVRSIRDRNSTPSKCHGGAVVWDRRLRSGQPVHTDEEDQLSIDDINVVTGDHQLPQRNEAFHRGESPKPILWRT